jgi:glycosyltransferase involved in cell wall biosynthesis
VKSSKSAAPPASLIRYARSTYRWLPLSAHTKHRLASVVFRLLAPFIRHTHSYRHWQAKQREAATDAALRSRAGERPAASLPQHFHGVFQASLQRSALYRPLQEGDVGTPDLKVIAFYLPQFHPVAENDAWWGRGFTEWTNVSRAVPQFAGHAQPKLPGELGFYDLRIKDVQRRQIELARKYGVHGFCYHHYWFAGRRLLQAPFEQVLQDPSLDLPFCLCWANENWTRRWDGAEQDVLIAQQHSAQDDIAFIDDILPALRDPRYIRIDGRPLLIVYRVSELPDPKATAARWNEHCRRHGVGDLHLVAAQTFGIGDPREYGFDAAVEFPPHNVLPDEIGSGQLLFNPYFRGRIFSYADMVRRKRDLAAPDYALYRCAFPGWDNTARKLERGHVFFGATPALFGEWMRQIARYTAKHAAPTAQVAFVNAWNEWGEGACLEPDRRHGYAWLETLGDVLADEQASDALPLVSVVIPAYGHAQYIVEALDSAFAQTYGRIEVIVVDDGSPDATTEVVKTYATDHPDRPLAWFRKPNEGSAKAIAFGIERASGDYIAILNSDDRFEPDRIRVLIERMLEEGLDLALSGVKFIDALGGSLEGGACVEAAAIGAKLAGIPAYPDLIYACLDSNVAVSTGNLVFRRRLHARLGGFSELRLCHDWEFLLAAMARYKVGFVEETSYAYRLHATNTFANLREVADHESGTVLRNFFEALDLEQAQALFADKRYCLDFLRQRGYEKFLPDDDLLHAWLIHGYAV